MAHPLVLALFASRASAMSAGKAVQALGVPSRAISVVARTHDEEGTLAEAMDATPGVELEDSAAAGRLGELSGVVLAAVALVMPGIGPIVAAGPLGAELGERMGHLAGGLPDILERASVESAKAHRWQTEVERGAVLLGVHVVEDAAERVAETLKLGDADDIAIARWAGELP